MIIIGFLLFLWFESWPFAFQDIQFYLVHDRFVLDIAIREVHFQILHKLYFALIKL